MIERVQRHRRIVDQRRPAVVMIMPGVMMGPVILNHGLPMDMEELAKRPACLQRQTE